jgi:hypothetical protein
MQMKKINSLFILLSLLAIAESYAQSALPKGEKQLNAGLGFSNFGTPVYIGVDFAVHDDLTVGPQVSYRSHKNLGYNFNILVISGNANYHFNTLLDIPSEFDLYAGLTLAYYSWSKPNSFPGRSNSGIQLEAQIGGRYYFDSQWAANLEFGGGNASGGKIGISYKF